MFAQGAKSKSIAAIIVLTSLLSWPALAESPARAQKAAEPQIVAEVGGVKVTQSELDQELKRQLSSQLEHFSEPQLHQIKKQLLSKMTDRMLLAKAAESVKLQPQAAEIDKMVGNLKKQLGGEENFSKTLSERGLDEKAFLDGVGKDLAIKAYVEQHIFKEMQVSDGELKKIFDESPERFSKPAEVHARHILLKVKPDAKPEEDAQAKERAEKIRQEAKQGNTPFDELAKKHSEGPSKEKGGDLGYFSKNQMVPAFGEAAFALQPGEISDLVKTRFGYHIIKVEDKRGGGKSNFEEVKEQVKFAVLAKKQREALEGHLKELRDKNKVIFYID